MSPSIYIIYNAKASVTGKLIYVYRKVTAAKDESICAACELTHGGINLTETEEWKETKAKIGASIRQLHLDELTEELEAFIAKSGKKTPLVLGRQSQESPIFLLMGREDLIGCDRKHDEFLKNLKKTVDGKGLKIKIDV